MSTLDEGNERIALLARLILGNADGGGYCPRGILRDVYSGKGSAPIRTGTSAGSARLEDPDDRLQRQRVANRGQNIKSAARGMRWVQSGRRSSSKGRSSSERLRYDLADLESTGTIVRDGSEGVRILDTAGLHAIAEA